MPCILQELLSQLQTGVSKNTTVTKQERKLFQLSTLVFSFSCLASVAGDLLGYYHQQTSVIHSLVLRIHFLEKVLLTIVCFVVHTYSVAFFFKNRPD